MEQFVDHLKEVGRTAAGGGVTYGATHAAFDVSQATQYASLAAAVMTAIYFFVVTVIAIEKRKDKSDGTE